MTGVTYTYERRVIGFTLVNGVPIAFMAVATNSYYWLPPEVVAGL